MKYLALDTIDVSTHSKPAILDNVAINMRGTKNLFDIFFSALDVEVSFNLALASHVDFTWINTPSGKEKYLTYKTLKSVLFPIKDQMPIIDAFLSWVDSLLFVNSKTKAFFCELNTSTAHTNTTELNTLNDIDDLDDLDYIDETFNYHSYERRDEDYIITALRHKVDQLEHQLELKSKDLDILQKDIQLRDKEIELLKLKLDTSMGSVWV